MKEIKKWVSDDGREFDSPEKAILADVEEQKYRIIKEFDPHICMEPVLSVLLNSYCRFLDNTVKNSSRFMRRIKKLRRMQEKAIQGDDIPF